MPRKLPINRLLLTQPDTVPESVRPFVPSGIDLDLAERDEALVTLTGGRDRTRAKECVNWRWGGKG